MFSTTRKFPKVLFAFAGILFIASSILSCSTKDSGKREPARRPQAGGATNGNGVPTPKPTPVSPYVPGTYPTPFPTINPGTGTFPPTGPVATPTPVPTQCYKASPFVCKIELLITEKTNRYRASVGKPPLTYDPKMAFVARDWALPSGGLSHRGFPSARSAVYQQEFGSTKNFGAENVAMSGRTGGSGQTDADAESIAEEFATMWWNSSGHRRNMVGGYTNLGMGMAQDGSGWWYGTQLFQ